MLHELFLLLSGNPSPLLTPTGLPSTFPLVSTSERALLQALATLGHLHISLRHACTSITTSHASTIARAVAGGIETHHLQAFRTRILAVESSILKREAGIVGGYGIVSLAKVYGGFEGWERTLRYLHGLVEAIAPGSSGAGGKGLPMSGAELVDRLRNDIYTGYPALEEVALHLLRIAEMAWLREVSTWVLYGRLPTGTDFFIKDVDGDGDLEVDDAETEGDGEVVKEYAIKRRLLPSFVTTETASSLLFVGRALSMIRLRGGSAAVAVNSSSAAVASPEMTLLPIHLAFLQELQSPLSPQKFLNAISAIRLSLSRHTLQTLLPAAKILDAIHVLREFYLLGRGEFALSLITESSEQARHRWRPGAAATTQSGGLLIKEGEVSAILTRTWGVLASLQGEEVLDERLDTARDLLYLSLWKPPPASTTPGVSKQRRRGGDENFRDLLVGVSISLNFNLSWPLELFLQPADVDAYDALFAYLISVRKAQTRLQSLWLGRRSPPTQHRNPALRDSVANTTQRRIAMRERDALERAVWASANLASFFFETLTAYWQGEVIESAFNTLVGLVAPTTTEETQQDPESLMRAHHAYLSTIRRDLFLSDVVFAPLLKRLLASCEILAGGVDALVRARLLHSTNIGVDAHNQYEERVLRGNVLERCAEVRMLLKQLVGRLQRIDEERENWSGSGDVFSVAAEKAAAKMGHQQTRTEERERGRMPQGLKVDRLLMRMDLGKLEL